MRGAAKVNLHYREKRMPETMKKESRLGSQSFWELLCGSWLPESGSGAGAKELGSGAEPEPKSWLKMRVGNSLAPNSQDPGFLALNF